ncbi:MAG: SLOG family protein [Acidobacteria bacterium]|nr:SLOG family protein [Acidobacteriota bacterium]
MARPTTWFTPLDRPPFVTEHHDPAGAPAGLRVLEISSRSDEPLGRSLSAMRLGAADTDDKHGLPVESIYQAAKCYGDRGPDEQPLPNGFDAKRRDRERRTVGALAGFEHNGTFWPAASGSAFYDRLWIKAAGAAAAEHPTRDLHGYAAFSDQFHRPGQSVACQARAAAMLVGLDRAGQRDTVFDVDKWATTLDLPPHARPVPAGARPMPDTPSKKTPAPEGNAPKPRPQIEGRVLVCGSRDFSDRSLVDAKLDEVRRRLGDVPMRVISGAARGADTLAANWAKERGVPCDEYPADWDRHGRSAGYRRNEQMLTEGKPHLVVGFPLGESRGTRMMMDIAAKAKVAVEEIDPHSRTTLTDSGKLYDIAAIARRSAITGRPAGRVEALGVGAIAKLPNNDPRTHGEARIVIGGVRAGAEPQLVDSKLDEVLARAHPAALRIAVAMQPGRDDLSTVAASWARRRGVRCDQYRTNDPAEADLTGRRMIAEQKPHAVVTFPRGEQSAARLAAIAARAGVPVEAVDATGNNHTRTGELADLQKARQSREQADPNPAWVVPIEGRTAAEADRRLGASAADAPWAKPGHTPAEPPPSLNLRYRSAYAAVRNGEAVRIDRRTDWGNPFPLRDRDDPDERREVLEQYRSYLADAIDSGKVDLDRLARLDGKQLACHCAPQACHGDILSQAASWAAGIERERERAQGPSRDQAEEQTPAVDPGAPVDTHVFDPGNDDWDEAPAPEERAAAERPPADRPELQHPDDLAADRLETYRARIAEAGASGKQLEAIGAGIETLRASAEQARADRRDAADRPMSPQMRRQLDEHNRTVERGRHEPGDVFVPPAQPPLPAPPPRPAPGATREVRVAVTGSWNHDNPHVVYGKLDEIRQRIDGAPMRVITGDSRGAQKLAAQWAREAGVPCDVHPTDWEGAKAQYDADAARAKNYDAEKAAIDKQYPPGTDHSVPDPHEPGTAHDPRQEALDELESAIEWQEKGEKAYRREAIRCRDEDMLDNGKPHLVVSFESARDRGGRDMVGMASDRGVPSERVDHRGTTLTLADQRPDLGAIGRRASDTLPVTPPQPPSPAADALQRNEKEQRSAEHTYETAATR